MSNLCSILSVCALSAIILSNASYASDAESSDALDTLTFTYVADKSAETYDWFRGIKFEDKLARYLPVKTVIGGGPQGTKFTGTIEITIDIEPVIQDTNEFLEAYANTDCDQALIQKLDTDVKWGSVLESEWWSNVFENQAWWQKIFITETYSWENFMSLFQSQDWSPEAWKAEWESASSFLTPVQTWYNCRQDKSDQPDDVETLQASADHHMELILTDKERINKMEARIAELEKKLGLTNDEPKRAVAVENL